MDIAAWQKIATQNPGQAAELSLARRQHISPAQQEAIWAWQHPATRAAFAEAPEGPLKGVPFAAKDLFHLRGVPTRSGGILPQRDSRKSSALLDRLQALGAVVIGKTHLHEFAYGLTGENPHYGQVTHPHFPERDAGGSSSGSAAAVAAGMVPFALGTDTAGSLRVPAAYTGLCAWRGVPREPWITDVYPLAPSFDTAGWLTRTLPDCLQLWHLLYGSDAQDGNQTAKGVYLPSGHLGLSADAECIAMLHRAAHHLTDQMLPPDHILSQMCIGVDTTYSVLQSTEAFAVHQACLDKNQDRYGQAVWQRINRGRHWTSAQLDAARLHALKIRAAYDTFFADYDFLVTPITLAPAPLVADRNANTRETLLRLNTHVSIAGRPALSLPVFRSDGLSLGLQVVFPSESSPAIPQIMERYKSCSLRHYDSR